jgi:putative ABC transport system permease protein
VDLDAHAKSALDAGRVLVGSPGLIKNGRAHIDIEQGDKGRTVAIPADVVDLGTGKVPKGREPQLAGAVMTPATAKANDIRWTTSQAISPRGAPTVSKAVEKRVSAAVSGVDPLGGGAIVERGFQESYTLPFLGLIGFGTLAVLIGTLTATGLALSDARPDFSTLAAVGAAPRTRRLVAGAQAIVLATLGALLGIAVGFAPGIAATWPLTTDIYTDGIKQSTAPVIDIPWLMLGVIVLAVPAVAALAAMLFTRSRLPLVRRLAQ